MYDMFASCKQVNREKHKFRLMEILKKSKFIKMPSLIPFNCTILPNWLVAFFVFINVCDLVDSFSLFL